VQSNMLSICRIFRGPSVLPKKTESHSAISNTFHDIEKQNPYQSKSPGRRPEPTAASVSSPMYNTSYLPGTVKAMCYEVGMRLRHMECEE